jgi:hypothetical protein
MKIDIGKAIRELLFDQQAVIVPGLGGFTSSPGSATVDYVQGVILPPAKKLEFNPNLVINDGVLVHHIQKAETITFQEAGEAVDRFVDDVKQALERREIIEIQEVGRLYKDYEHKIRFLPEGTNFNADAFGLPTVQFSPLAKERPKEASRPGVKKTPVTPVAVTEPQAVPVATSDAVVTNTPPVTTKPLTSMGWLQKMLPWLVLLTAVVIATSLFLMFGMGDKTNNPPAGKERINVKPQPDKEASVEEDSEKPAAGGTKPEPLTETKSQTSPQTQAVPEKSVPENVDIERDASPSGLQQIYLVVHSFGSKENATRFARTLSEDGYSPETKKVGNLYRVGVVFSYDNKQDIESMRKELARKYKAGPKTEKEMEEQE